MNGQAFFRTVSEQLRAACTRGEVEWSVLAEWERWWTACQEQLPLLEQKVAELQSALVKALEPPLQYAVALGPSPGSERDLIVGNGHTRMEVHLSPAVDVPADAIAPGQEVLLNKEQNVVAVRGPYTGGETAEVVNILKPESAAEILEVLVSVPDEPPMLRVRWREDEELEVACAPDLAGRPLQRGDIVALDPDQQLAVARVRPRLHVRAGGHEGIVVEISQTLLDQGVRIGDIVRVDSGLQLAFEKLPSYETGGLALEDIPDVSYEDIGGLEDQIEQVYDAIELPYLHRARFEAFQLSRPKGILLFGPPGCGKTMIAKAVANSLTRSIRVHLVGLERRIVLYRRLRADPADQAALSEAEALLLPESEGCGAALSVDEALRALEDYLRDHRVNLERLDQELQTIRGVLAAQDGVRGFFLNVKGPELLDKYVGETEHRIRKIFEEARRHATFYTPVVIFFDEMEAMFRARGTGRSSDVETTIVPQFLVELAGVETSDNLIIIGASNRSELIDPAIMRAGRLDIKIKVDRPTRDAALDIFALYLLPTLPLDARGLPEAAMPDVLDGLGRVVFRTAYRSAAASTAANVAAPVAALTALLPDGCDLRLARATLAVGLEALAALPPRMPVREVLGQGDGAEPVVQVLRRYQGATPVGQIVERLGQLQAVLREDPSAQALVLDQVRREWLAEALILEAIQALYSPASLMNVLTAAGNRYTFYLKDFVSGAVIANFVARAKKRAVKRVVLGQERVVQGICLDDLLAAVRSEFEEGKDQLAQNKLSAELGLDEPLKFVELVLQTGQPEAWNEVKLRPYLTFG